jgi:hypothetical protein
MGYTNHWQRPTELDATAFGKAVADLRRVLPDLGVTLAGFDGHGTPTLDDDHIVFNGKVPHLCEPFEIARVEFDPRGRDRFFSFCKTEHQPYDLVVKAALIILFRHLGESLAVGSDGSDADWEVAKTIVQKSLGYGGTFKPHRE